MVTFAISLLVYFLFRPVRPSDVVYVTSGPIFCAYAVHLLSFVKPRMRYVLDIRDLWPQTIAGLGHMREDGRVYRFLKAWTDAAHRRAVASVGVVDEIRDYVRDVAPSRPAYLIYNPVDTEFFRPLPEPEVRAFRQDHPDLFGDPGRVVFLYSGVHSNAMDLWTLIRAVKSLKERTDRFLFVLIGYGEQKSGIQSYAAEHGLSECVRFMDYMPRTELLKYICAADACYSSTSSKPIYRMVVPTKMCEYMACNKFVVAVHECPFADKAAKAGNVVVSPPGEAEPLAQLLYRLTTDRSWRLKPITARDYIVAHHSVAAFQSAVASVFSALTSGDRVPPRQEKP
jgi:glycosyltransferase involved in cell wall biosynthesis